MSNSVTRRRGLSLKDLDGHPIGPPPATLPPYVGREPSLGIQVREMVEKLYPAEEVFRKETTSVNGASSVTGNRISDKTLAAIRILNEAKKLGLKPLADQNESIIGKIVKQYLPAAMAKHGMSRQDLIAAAIERGKTAANDAAE